MCVYCAVTWAAREKELKAKMKSNQKGHIHITPPPAAKALAGYFVWQLALRTSESSSFFFFPVGLLLHCLLWQLGNGDYFVPKWEWIGYCVQVCWEEKYFGYLHLRVQYFCRDLKAESLGCREQGDRVNKITIHSLVNIWLTLKIVLIWVIFLSFRNLTFTVSFPPVSNPLQSLLLWG